MEEMPKIDPPTATIPETAKKKRGRPPGTKNKTSTVPGAANVSLDSANPSISDNEVGRTFAGIFLVTSIGLGPHWRLFPHEETEIGRCFGPIFRRYPEKFGQYMDLLMCGPVVASVVVPRLGVEKAIAGGVPREKGRELLSLGLSIMEAEKKRGIAEMAIEGEALLKKFEEKPTEEKAA